MLDRLWVDAYWETDYIVDLHTALHLANVIVAGLFDIYLQGASPACIPEVASRVKHFRFWCRPSAVLGRPAKQHSSYIVKRM